MKQEVFTYLKSYSFNPEKINRLIVSAFLYSHNIISTKNKKIKELIITKESDDFKALSEFLEIQKITSFEDLIEVFEFVISPQEKIVTGAIYTPNYIREYILESILSDIENYNEITICDPACGCAGFLYNAAKKIKNRTNKTYFDIFKTNIFGLDIQEYSVRRSKLLLSLLAIIEGEDNVVFEFNFFNGNALNFNWEEDIPNFNGFDIVVGNPPYVCSRNIDDETKEYLKLWTVCSSGHPDLYIPFFEIGLSILKSNGYLGYITMNTFFKSINGRALREYFQKEKNEFKLIDFGGQQVFQSKSTYTCLCLIKKTNSSFIEYSKMNIPKNLASSNIIFNRIPYKLLGSLNGWNLQEMETVNKIESIGTPLGEKFQSRNGIATLKNSVYIFEPIRVDDNFYYLKSDGIEYKIERASCVEVVNPNKLIKLDSVDSIRKKIIFPYSILGNRVDIIEEIQFSKNHPFTYQYLLSKKSSLASRDKGEGKNYDVWYKYGRNQSLEPYLHKLFFPHITPCIPNYVMNDETDLLFVNGLAIVSDNQIELRYLKKIMSSRLFWYYITNSSKPYGSGYYSLSRNYIKNFGIYDFNEEQIEYLIYTEDQDEIDSFLESLYEIELNDVDNAPLEYVIENT